MALSVSSDLGPALRGINNVPLCAYSSTYGTVFEYPQYSIELGQSYNDSTPLYAVFCILPVLSLHNSLSFMSK